MDDALATIYTAHVTMNKLRHDRALQAAGFDHAVIFSGALHYQFLDDMPYPFKVNPHFKGWAPVTDNPNSFVVYTPGLKPKLAATPAVLNLIIEEAIIQDGYMNALTDGYIGAGETL